MKREGKREIIFIIFALSLLITGYYLVSSYSILSPEEKTKISEKVASLTANKEIEKSTNILCLVLARPSNDQLQKAVTETWGKECADLLFLFGNKTESALVERQPHVYTLNLPVEDHYDNTWMKIRAALTFVDNKWTEKFDWVLRIDDDAFVIFENLKKLIKPLDPDKSIMFGAYYDKLKGGYIGTGPGLLLSRGAFTDLMTIFDDKSVCHTKLRTHNDDVELGACLRAAKVPVGKSSDDKNRPRYISISLKHLLNKTSSNQYKFFAKYSAYPIGERKGMKCCSDELIALHYTQASDIRLYFQRMTENPNSKKNLKLFVKGVVNALKYFVRFTIGAEKKGEKPPQPKSK